jgi:hypothetical protein
MFAKLYGNVVKEAGYRSKSWAGRRGTRSRCAAISRSCQGASARGFVPMLAVLDTAAGSEAFGPNHAHDEPAGMETEGFRLASTVADANWTTFWSNGCGAD